MESAAKAMDGLYAENAGAIFGLLLNHHAGLLLRALLVVIGSMNPARRACCNQWLRTGNNQSHVEPLFINKREHELSVHKASASCLRPSPASMQATAAFAMSPKPEGFVILGSLAHETRPCRRLLSVGSHLCSQTASAQSLAGLHLP